MAIKDITSRKRKDGRNRVHWREEDLTLVIPKVVDLITGNPKLSLGRAFVMAQDEVLQPARRRAPSLAYAAEASYGKMVEKEIKRREKAVEKSTSKLPILLPHSKGTSKATLRGPALGSLPEPTAAPAGDPLMDMVSRPEQFRDETLPIDQSMGSLVSRLIRSVGAAYEEALYEELRSRGQRAVMRAAMAEAEAMRLAGMAGMPPAPAPRVSLLEHKTGGESTAGKPSNPKGKMKIGLVGSPADDWRYFSRIKDGLADKIDFVEIVKLKDAPKAPECNSIIFSGSVEQKVLNAVKASAPHVHQVFNKRPDIINQMLSEQVRNWDSLRLGSEHVAH